VFESIKPIPSLHPPADAANFWGLPDETGFLPRVTRALRRFVGRAAADTRPRCGPAPLPPLANRQSARGSGATFPRLGGLFARNYAQPVFPGAARRWAWGEAAYGSIGPEACSPRPLPARPRPPASRPRLFRAVPFLAIPGALGAGLTNGGRPGGHSFGWRARLSCGGNLPGLLLRSFLALRLPPPKRCPARLATITAKPAPFPFARLGPSSAHPCFFAQFARTGLTVLGLRRLHISRPPAAHRRT